MAYERKDYSGARASTTLAGTINNSASSFSIASATGWPSGANGKFYAVIDPGTASEEKVLVTSRTGTTLNSVTRGVDGSSAAEHEGGATIYPCFTATDADEANYAVAQTVGLVQAAGDMLVGSAANTLARVAKGTNGQVWRVASDSPGWGALPTDSVDSAQIKENAVGSSEIASNAVTLGKIAAAARYKEVTFSKSGTLSAGSGTHRWYAKVACTIVDVWASVGTAPTGQALIVDVHHNGTTIFTTQSNRPQISASGFFDESGAPDGDVTLAAGEYLTVDIDQVGSGTAGSDLVVGIRYYETGS